MLCTDGVIIYLCCQMLLANPGMLLYWMIVYAYVLHTYYLCMWILAHMNLCMSQFMEWSISLYPFPHNIKKISFQMIYRMIGNLITCCILIYCPRYTSVCYHHIIFALSVCYM